MAVNTRGDADARAEADAGCGAHRTGSTGVLAVSVGVRVGGGRLGAVLGLVADNDDGRRGRGPWGGGVVVDEVEGVAWDDARLRGRRHRGGR